MCGMWIIWSRKKIQQSENKSMSKIFKKLFLENENEKGFRLSLLDEVEGRLGLKLPQKLKHFYQTQVRNVLINSCHNFVSPENLKIRDSDWLPFYVENQGICFWAMNRNDFYKKEQKIYVNYEGQGYEEEAKTFDDFFIVRAACDYPQYIYPYRMRLSDTTEENLQLLLNKLDSPNSDISPKDYFRRRLFWNDENEVIRITESLFDNRVQKFISIVSKNSTSINFYKKLLPSENWQVDKKEIWTKEGLPSYLEKYLSKEEARNSIVE